MLCGNGEPLLYWAPDDREPLKHVSPHAGQRGTVVMTRRDFS
jgi:hypothetical protein